MRIQFAVVAAQLVVASSSFAGARIDLRLDPPMPPEGYRPCSTITVNVYFIDTGNPEGDISFNFLVLDFTDSMGSIAYPGPDAVSGTPDDNEFVWYNPLGIAPVFPALPVTIWAWKALPPVPQFGQITMLDNGEAFLGSIVLSVGSIGGTLDVRNADEPNPNFGALAHYGGYDGVPLVTWRSFTGELTGGVIDLPIAHPEHGDINDDQLVDEDDFALFHEQFCHWICPGKICSCHPPTEPDPAADFNADERVDLIDFALFQNAYTGSCF